MLTFHADLDEVNGEVFVNMCETWNVLVSCISVEREGRARRSVSRASL